MSWELIFEVLKWFVFVFLIILGSGLVVLALGIVLRIIKSAFTWK
jgi:hypothetical protein